jgi:hypothetical protein
MRDHACWCVALVVLSAIGCGSPQAPAGKAEVPASKAEAGQPRAAASDVCDLASLGTAMFACLLPESDSRHDSSKRVAPNVDCFWQQKAPMDKEVRGEATGAMMSYTFDVTNKCAGVNVEVEFRSPPGTLSIWQCRDDRLAIAAGDDDSFVCYTSYDKGAATLSRTYSLHVVGVNGQLAGGVELDPEVVLERAGSGRSLPVFLSGPAQ